MGKARIGYRRSRWRGPFKIEGGGFGGRGRSRGESGRLRTASDPWGSKPVVDFTPAPAFENRTRTNVVVPSRRAYAARTLRPIHFHFYSRNASRRNATRMFGRNASLTFIQQIKFLQAPSSPLTLVTSFSSSRRRRRSSWRSHRGIRRRRRSRDGPSLSLRTPRSSR